ncbi:unnamed protein product [Closterium sp. NIES-54]
MVIVLERELAALSMRPGDDVKPVLDKIKDTYARMAAAGSKIQQGFRRHHMGDGAANKTNAEGYGAAGGSRGRGGGRGRGCGRGFGRGRGGGDYNEGHGSSGGRWKVHVGCTSYMTPRADLLDEVMPPGKIKFVTAASGALLPVIGVGNAKVKRANEELVGLGNVLLVEGLSANLLSMRRLQKSKAEVAFGPTSCRAKLGKLLLWNLEEKRSCIKDLWQLPIIPWNGKPLATAAAAATTKVIAGGEETAPTAGALDAVKKVQQTQKPHGEVLAGVDGTAAWAKASRPWEW